MKILVYLLITMFSLFGCKSENKQTQTLTDKEWSDILNCTLALAKGDKPYIFKEYGNIELKNITSGLYINCGDLGYKINDSILSCINNRKNKPITNKLDTMFNISFVSDTIGFNHNFEIYSEPFYVNNEILCVSMLNRILKEGITRQWVFFLKKQNGEFKIITFYDVQKDTFYKSIPLK